MSEVFDLELQGVVKEYGSATAVSDVNLGIRKGEFISLLGPSGCGKSTTLMMIAGFDDPTRGEILIRGKRIDHLMPEKRNIGIVFQSYALFPHMSVWKNVEYGLKMRNVPADERRQRVDRILRLVHMIDYAQRLPRELSGGQQQRVALARALVIEPDLLLLDEPFSALDRSLREELQREIRALQKKLNITTIFVTHDQEEALLMSDRIAVMRQGKIEQCATPPVLYKKPATRFVAGFIGRGTFIPAQRASFSEAGSSTFLTPLGDVNLPAENVSSGAAQAETSLFFRPEDVRSTASATGGLNAVGKVSVLYFQGANRFADITVPGLDDMVLVDVSRLNGDLSEGADCPIHVPQELVRSFHVA